MYRFAILGCVLCSLVCSTFGQKSTPQTTEIQPSLLSRYKDRIERLNNSVLDERVRVSAGERVFLFASLAKIWKNENPGVAKEFLKDAIDEASPLLTDDPKERGRKLGWLRKLVGLSGQIDSGLTEQIIRKLKSESATQPNQGLQNSIALTKASIATIATNPKLGLDMTIGALGYLEKPSQNEEVYNVILLLATKDKNLSEDLFLRVLQFAQITSDFESIGRLALFTSPKSTTLEVDFLSDNSKKYVLRVFVEHLIRLSALSQQRLLPDEQKEQACVLFLIGKGLSGTIGAYLPDQSALMSQVAQQSSLCQQGSTSSNTQSVFDEGASDKKDLTIEELIRAGEGARAPTKKAFYFGLAVGKLSREKKFEKALELLDDMDEPTRKAMGTDNNDDLYWRAVRQSNAVDAVLQLLEAKDFGRANRIVENTPSHLRPTLQIQVGRAILAKVSKVDSSNPEQSFAFTLIADARRNLPNIDDPFASVNLYLSLIRRYAALLPDEVTLVFRETVKAINRADHAKDEKEYQGRDFSSGDDVISLPVSLLEQEDIVLNYIEDIQRPYSRVRLKLGLLSACLTEYLVEKKKVGERVVR